MAIPRKSVAVRSKRPTVIEQAILLPYLIFRQHARRIADDALAGRDVTNDDRAGSRGGTLADLERRDERGVRAEEHVFADRRVMLLRAVVVARDRACADVGTFADARIADIREVCCLDAGHER